MAVLLGVGLGGTTATSCAGTSPTVVTGATLDGLGTTFVATGDLFNRGLKAGAVTPEEYRVWAAFAVRFKASYPVAVDLWRASSTVEDAATTEKVTAILQGFSAELGALFADVTRAWTVFASKDGGR